MNDPHSILVDHQTFPLPYEDEALHIWRHARSLFVNSESTLAIQVKGPACDLDIEDSVDGLILTLGERPIALTLFETETLSIMTTAGSDRVRLRTARPNPVRIDTGDGNDDVVVQWSPATALPLTEARRHSVFINGGAGNDRLVAHHSAHATLHGLEGDDILYSTAQHSLLYGAEGNDTLITDNEESAVVPGPGDNLLVLGAGRDRVYGDTPQSAWISEDRIYTRSEENLGKSLHLQGDDTFRALVTDQIRLLQASPSGSRLLKALDDTGARIRIEYTEENGNAHAQVTDGSLPMLRNNRRGQPSREILITLNPTATFKHIPSIVMLYHELVHAWNLATGSRYLQDRQAEDQAVGLPTGGRPFDFDDDPATPPSDTNPWPFHENAIREELGLRRRENYDSY